MKQHYRLPGGTNVTDDVHEMISAWKKLYEPIEKLTGWKCTGFDPGMQFNKIRPIPDSKFADYGRSIELDTTFVNDLLDGISKLQRREKRKQKKKMQRS